MAHCVSEFRDYVSEGGPDTYPNFWRRFSSKLNTRTKLFLSCTSATVNFHVDKTTYHYCVILFNSGLTGLLKSSNVGLHAGTGELQQSNSLSAVLVKQPGVAQSRGQGTNAQVRYFLALLTGLT